MARPFKSAGRHACNCLIPSRHAISHSTIQVIPEVTPEASALFLNNSTSGLHARWRYLVYPILAPDRELLVLRVCAKFIGEKPAGYQPAARCSQNSSQRPLSWEQRRAIIALAWLTVQRIPDCFSRCPVIVLQPASTTPEPTKRPWLRNWA